MDKIKDLAELYKGCLLPEEINYLTNFTPKCSKFYVLPKIHKSEEIANICENVSAEYVFIGHCPKDLPSRPIVNNIQSPTSHLSHFLDKILSPFVSAIPSHIKDSFDLLEKLPTSNQEKNTFVNLDVVSLYTVIPKSFGLDAVTYFLLNFPSLLCPRFSVSFILDALNIVLSNNVFYFQKKFYLQKIGTAMGTKVAPKYATMVLAYMEKQVEEQCKNRMGLLKTNAIFSKYWRYLDDILVITNLAKKDIETFLEIMCSFHASFKFTHSLSTKSTHFLDIFIYTNDDVFHTDIYYKPTDSFQYLHFYSSHPRHIKRNIPYCLAQRISRIVSENRVRENRLQELKSKLLELKYPAGLIDDAIKKVNASYTNKLEPKTQNNRVFHSFDFHPNNLSLFHQHIAPAVDHLNAHSLQHCPVKVTPCLRQPPNILRALSHYEDFKVSKCGRPRCKTCPDIIEVKKDITLNNVAISLNANMNCESKNLVYVLVCVKCKQIYIGETELSLAVRNTLHRQHVRRPEYTILKASKHMQSCGEGYKIAPIFKIKVNSSYVRSKMEFYFRSKLKPTLNGI
jgi:hypothetical protein